MLKKIATLAVICFSFQFAFAANHIVLVPGFFNSLIPAPQAEGDPWKQPYFSQDIVKALIKNGDTVWVVDNLNPIGGIEENGKRLIRFLTRHLAARSRVEREKQLVLVGHSAGGLYALYAAANSDLPISRLITLSTPFKGLRFLDALREMHLPLQTIAAPFSLTNLLQLMEDPVQSFLSQLKLQRPLQIDLYAGYQPLGFSIWNFQVLSSALIGFQTLTDAPSDGIVTVESSLDASTLLQKNPNLKIVAHPESIELEHWEMVAESQIFRILGVLNTESLRRAQIQIYQDLLRISGL